MSTPSRSYAVRDAGSPSRPGKVHKTYPYTLDAPLQVLEEARLRSFSEGPQVITVVTGRSSQGEVSRQGHPALAVRRRSTNDVAQRGEFGIMIDTDVGRHGQRQRGECGFPRHGEPLGGTDADS